MHPRVENLPNPDPDYRRFLAAVGRGRPDHVPLIELAVHPIVMAELLDDPGVRGDALLADPALAARHATRLLHRLGYDVVKVSAPIPFAVSRPETSDASSLSSGSRTWQDQHQGPIRTPADCEAFPWPRPADVDFRPLETATEVLPDGMRLIGFCGGVLEFASDLMGLEGLMYAVYDQPALLETVINRVGQTILSVFETYCEMESVCALWLGDDLGSKNGLLVSPDFLRRHILPWYARFAELAHRHGKPYLFHTCGRTEAIMPSLIEDVGIDAKHSFEDAIQPVERFIEQWGDKVAVMGGIDVNLLSVADETAVADRTMQVLQFAAPRGGYACGSGNSIPDYVPARNYLAMVEAVHRFNGRM